MTELQAEQLLGMTQYIQEHMVMANHAQTAMVWVGAILLGVCVLVFIQAAAVIRR